MKSSKRRNSYLVSPALAALLAIAASGTARAADPTYKFDIPAESLSQALTDFSQTSSQQIIYSEDLIRGRKSSGLHGTFTAEQALDALLAGTDLKLEINAAGVMMVRSKNVQAASNEAAAPSASIETVVVTGTQIAGVKPISPLITMTSTDMVNSGYTRLDQALAQLPQQYGGSVSELSNPNFGGGETAAYNNTFASGVNLYGLGGNATLTLLNGQRLPESSYGYMTDVSKFPLSMIDHVDILTDGATATYGADAVAGVVNIVTKTDYSGVETGVRVSSIADGKSPNYDAYALAGVNWDTGNALVTYDFDDENPLFTSARPWAANPTETANVTALFPKTSTNSLFGSVRQAIGSDATLNANVFYSNRSFDAPYRYGPADPQNDNNGVSNQVGGTLSLNYALTPTWSADLVADYGQSDDHTNSLSFGSLIVQDNIYKTESIELRSSGELFDLPGGAAHLAVGALYRHESIKAEYEGGLAPTDENARDVGSAYAELSLPIIAEGNGVPLVDELTVDIAGRYDHYSDFGGTSNPKYGIRWKPTSELSVHATYGTSFRAPTLFESVDYGAYSFVETVPNPSSPSGTSLLLGTDNQGTSGLKPETARSINAGLSYQPSYVPGLELDGTYFDIDFQNKIERLITEVNLYDPYASAALLGPFINNNPTPAQINKLLSLPTFYNLTGAPFTPSQIQAIAYLGITNAAIVHPRGLDFSAKYAFDTDIGHFGLSASGTYFISYDNQITSTSQVIQGLNEVSFPDRLKLTAQANWSLGAWAAYGRVNFAGAYRDQYDMSCGGEDCPIGSYTTFDLGTSYSLTDSDSPMLNNVRLSLDVSNVFDQKPPYVGGFDLQFDPANASPLGRAFSIGLIKRW